MRTTCVFLLLLRHAFAAQIGSDNELHPFPEKYAPSQHSLPEKYAPSQHSLPEKCAPSQHPKPSETGITYDDSKIVSWNFGWETDVFMKSIVETDHFKERLEDLIPHFGKDTLNTMKTAACSALVQALSLLWPTPTIHKHDLEFEFEKLSQAFAIVFVTSLAVRTGMPHSLQDTAFLKEETLAFLLKNPEDVCRYFSLEHLQLIRPEFYELVTPECLKSIKDLCQKVISKEFLENARDDLFSHYNGELNLETLQNMTGKQLTFYGSRLDEKNLCRYIDIRNIQDWETRVSAKCLVGSILNTNFGISVLSWQKILNNSALMADPMKWIYEIITRTSENSSPSVWLNLRGSSRSEPMATRNHDGFQANPGFAPAPKTIDPSLRPPVKVLIWSMEVENIQIRKPSLLPGDLFAQHLPEKILGFIQTEGVLSAFAYENEQVIRGISPAVCAMVEERFYGSYAAFPLRRYGSRECKEALQFRNIPESRMAFPEINPLDDLKEQQSLEWLGTEGVFFFLDQLTAKEAWALKKVECIDFMSKEILKTIGSDLIEAFAPYISRHNASKLSDRAFEKITHADFIKLGKPDNDTLELQDLSCNQISRIWDVNAQEWGMMFERSGIEGIINLLRLCPILVLPFNAWNAFEKGNGSLLVDIFRKLGPGGCYTLHEIITPKIAARLPDTAFCQFTAAAFQKLTLKDLRPKQIEHLSSDLPRDKSVFSSISLEEMDPAYLIDPFYCSRRPELEKKFNQFRSELTFNSVKKAERIGVPLVFCLIHVLDDLLSKNSDSSPDDKVRVYAEIEKWADFSQKIPRSDTFTKDSHWFSCHSNSIFLVLKPRELRKPLQLRIASKVPVLDVKSNESSFELSEIYQFILANPKYMLGPLLELKIFGNLGTLESACSLIEQILEDFKDRFTINVPGSEARKLGECLSEELGTILGVLVVKAVQLNMTLPFVLHSEIYSLIIDPSKENILAYYSKHYPKKALNCNIDPSKMTFTSIDRKSNLLILDNERGENGSCNYPVDLEDQIRTKMLNEFELLIESLSNTICEFFDCKKLGVLQKHFSFRVRQILVDNIDRREICPEEMVSTIKWEGFADLIAVPSFISGKKAFVREIFESIILALNQTELSKLMRLWTGASTVVLDNDEKLIVQLLGSTELGKNRLEETGRKKEHIDVAGSGDESLMKRVFDVYCKRYKFEGYHFEDHKDQLFKDSMADAYPAISFTDRRLQLVRLPAAVMVQKFKELLESLPKHFMSPLGLYQVFPVPPSIIDRPV